MEEIRLYNQLILGKYPSLFMVLYIPGAGFLPSTYVRKFRGVQTSTRKKTSWESKRDPPIPTQMPRFSLEIAGPIRGLFSGTMKVII